MSQSWLGHVGDRVEMFVTLNAVPPAALVPWCHFASGDVPQKTDCVAWLVMATRYSQPFDADDTSLAVTATPWPMVQ